MRLAIERFTQKLKMSPAEGVKVFYEQFLYDNLSRYTSHPWREERYWNEECDTVIKENADTLRDFFNQWGQSTSPGDPKVLRLQRLIELITASGVCDDNFGAREIGPLFNLAMQTKVNEIHSTRHMDMQYAPIVHKGPLACLLHAKSAAVCAQTTHARGLHLSCAGWPSLCQ